MINITEKINNIKVTDDKIILGDSPALLFTPFENNLKRVSQILLSIFTSTFKIVLFNFKYFCKKNKQCQTIVLAIKIQDISLN